MLNMNEIINTVQQKMEIKLYSLDYAKGYCYGALHVLYSNRQINDDEYDDYARQIDDLQNICGGK